MMSRHGFESALVGSLLWIVGCVPAERGMGAGEAGGETAAARAGAHTLGEARGGVPPLLISCYEIPGGGMGALAYTYPEGTSLLRSEGTGRRRVALDHGLAGALRRVATHGAFVAVDPELRSARYLVIELDSGEVVQRSPMTAEFPSSPQGACLVIDGAHRYALIECENGERFVVRSADGGRSWEDPILLGVGWPDDAAVCSPLVRTSQGLVCIYPSTEGLVQVTSHDGGRSWREEAAVSRLPFASEVRWLAGDADGDRVDLLCRLVGGEMVHCVSTDGGVTWEGGTRLGRQPDADVVRFPSLDVAFGVCAVAFTEAQGQGFEFLQARVLVSRDQGRSWRPVDLDAGQEGRTGLPVVEWVGRNRLIVAYLQETSAGGRGVFSVLAKGIDLEW